MSNCSVSRRNRQQRPGDSGYAQILRTLLFLSIPTIVEEVLATLLQYVDTAMVVLEGIFYGLGRTRYSFIVETVAWPFLNLVDKRLPENLKKFFHRF